jgi:hypothetical protein
MKRLALAFVLLAAACSSKKPEPTTPTGGGATAATTVTLELGELKLIDLKQNAAVLVHATGAIEIPSEPEFKGAKVTADGKIVKTETGEVGLTLMPDGTIQGPDGKLLDVTLSADGVIKSGDKTISVNADGTIAGANPDAPPMKIEGATTPGLKRTAMFVLIVLTMPGKVHEEVTPGPAPTK